MNCARCQHPAYRHGSMRTTNVEDYACRVDGCVCREFRTPPPSDPPLNDPVNSPSHYRQGPIEVIDIIEGFHLGFHLGNVVKYVLRAEHKNGLEDLKKARWYLDRFIESEDPKCQDAKKS